MTKAEILLSWLNAAFGEHSRSALDLWMTEDATVQGLLTQVPVEKRELGDLVPALASQTGPSQYRIGLTIEEGDWIAAKVILMTSSLETGEAFEITDHMMVRFEGDKIAEVQSHADYVTLFEKQGLLPPETLASCLSGQKLVLK
ncbi:hypothetical protein RSK20926_17997 [Roseobacter sp. SK209-2-6]|uniref:nuclear transport factor 2 family protein n=1 Tax=Roseobacter sp. SK209-2-6 TaxID=388739 RepID=UPI0000F3F6FD|nr:nuclear transport factor 2 family protein [Roseobacter sp. SK209-2-6]EBA17656.1 hypothetical protein RSK20926_17997 [Roseobacter sp. SK209-2-6]